MSQLSPIDEIQSHILGVITGIMVGYNLNPDHVQARYEYVISLQPNEIVNSYQETAEPTEETTTLHQINNLTPISVGRSWADYDNDDAISIDVSRMDIDEQDILSEESNLSETSSDNTVDTNTPVYVSTRKQFCATMQKGVKICPRYSSCQDSFCKNFHVMNEHICPHVTRGSYCDTDGCDLIVIRACRKGKRCNDSECSFRHPN